MSWITQLCLLQRNLFLLIKLLAHVISGACKAGVVDVQYEDWSIDTSSTRAKMNKVITWKNKSPKDAVALIQVQKHCKLVNVRLLAPAKNRFAYILHSFKSLPVNKYAIDYMCVPIPGVGNEIKTRKPLDEDWEVVHVVVHTMKEVVVSTHKNELVGR